MRNVFVGSTYQKGRGVGHGKVVYFGKTVGKETLRVGINVLDDVTNNGTNFKEAVKF